MPVTVLAVVPHPDDESYGFAGFLALAARAGWRCVVLCVSSGERGERYDGIPAGSFSLGEVREAELRRSCEVLGIDAPRLWGMPDGCLDAGDSSAIARLGALLDDLRPDIVLSLGPDGAYGHPDHLAVYAWVVEATRDRGAATLFVAFPPGLFAPQYQRCVASGIMGDPPLVPEAGLGVELADYEVGIAGVRETKLASIAAHRTQLPGGDPEALFPPGIVPALLFVERFADARGAPSLDTLRLIQSLAPPSSPGPRR